MSESVLDCISNHPQQYKPMRARPSYRYIRGDGPVAAQHREKTSSNVSNLPGYGKVETINLVTVAVYA